ncbi:hypothetical protein H072_8262 [Dactylellina haptotyla CBS 200.50]|uniref:Rhodopsin domain-containing protein n=1 Tax=Dactylellina haptotyla (strain CBS 200.50) TaxID=1284197 RepID=S8A5E3_DACHA|nr:hypothetical protein H072_8262 [Dactylellina haptotyla CBS 200.50]
MEAPQNLTTSDLDVAAAICINVAFLARNFYDSTTLDVIYALAEFYLDHPNVTNQEIIEFSGARLNDLTYLENFVGGPENVRDSIYWVAQVSPYLPRTPGTGHILIPIFWVFTILTTFVLGLRLWSRQTIAGGIRAYDWIMVVGYFMTLGYGSVALYHAININRTSQFWDYSWNEVALQQAFYMALDVLYPCTSLVIKSSLLLFYYNLSPARYLKWCVWATFAFSVATVIAAVSYSLFKCAPVAYWTEWYTSVCDTHQTIPYLVTGAAMILSDIIIWVMPLPMVMRLQLYRRERIAAIFTFSLGIFACIASGFRLSALHRYFLTSGGTGKTPIINAWTIVELNLAIICASAPALRALCIKHVPKLLSYGPSNSSVNERQYNTSSHSNQKVHGRVIIHHDQIARSNSSLSEKASTSSPRIGSPV